MTRRLHWAVGAMLLLLLTNAFGPRQWMGPSTSSAAPRADAVTLVVTQYRSVTSGARVLEFSGTVASGAGGEIVDVLGQDCGRRGYRLIGETQTRAGGGWQLQNPEQVAPWRYTRVYSGTTFRARWKGQLSDPYLWRLPAFIGAVKIPGRRAWRVFVSPESPWISLKGKTVELQRWSRGRWVLYRRARLAHKPSYEHGAFSHEAVFAVPARGLRLRAFLRARSAAPCYLAAVTPPWRS